jgi:6-phosphofructokinase
VVQEDLTDKATSKSIEEIYAAKVVYDEHGNIQHGRAESFSPAVYLAELVNTELKVEAVPGKVKDCVLNPQHIQRSYSMSPVDASEAYAVGHAAVEAMLAGETKKSVILERKDGVTRTSLTDLSNIAAKDRKVPAEYINGIEGPTQAFIDEFIYLIGGPVALPHYSNLRFPAVKVPDKVSKNPYVRSK